jgi:putative ABC transport system permease protein
LSPGEFLDWRDHSEIFEHVVAFAPWLFTASGPGEPEMLHAYRVTPGLFEMLGVQPMIGRVFSPEEEKPGGARVMVLRYSLWKRRYGGDPNVIGQKLVIDDRVYTIVGVMPPDFQFFNRQSEVLMPIGFDPTRFNQRNFRPFRAMGRLKPGLSLEQVQVRANVFSKQLARDYPESNRGWSVELVPLPEDTAGALRPALLVLLGAVGLVLLIACANVANLLLVQATSREKEIALRVALGARRGRIVRQFLTESLLLSLLGGVLGFGLGYLTVAYFQTLIPAPTSFGRYMIQMDRIRIDTQVLGFSFFVTVATGLIFGLLPALRASKPDLNESLKSTGGGSIGGRQSARIRNLLVVGEIALAVVMVIGAGLMIQSFLNLYKVGPGLRAENVISIQVRFPYGQYREAEKRKLLNDQLFERLEAIPGVRSAGAVSNLPLTDWFHPSEFSVEGRATQERGDVPQTRVRTVTPNYYQTMGIPLLRGRVFGREDTPDSPPVAVINEAMSRRYWRNEDPIGKRLKPGRYNSKAPWLTIVGMVGNVRDDGMDKEPYPVLYFSQSQYPMLYLSLVIHTDGDPSYLPPLVQREVNALNPGVPLYRIWKMEDVVRDSTWKTRYAMILLSGLAGLSLILALIGVYGVMSFSVAQRTQEIGIRMALGAQPDMVRRLIVRQGLQLAVAGVLSGVAASLALMRLLASQLFGVKSFDPATYLGVSATLMVVALLASYFPARRATKVDPMVALRYE